MMVLSDQHKRHKFEQIIAYRNLIKDSIQRMLLILREEFPDEYDMAYQHWVPQILTALEKDSKWLQRGEYSLQDTIKSILDKEFDK